MNFINSRLICKYTSFMRLLPNFIIIGAAKSGTTSLFNYMIQHPDIIGSYVKEVHFFDSDNYKKGNLYYKSYFPLKIQAHLHQLVYGRNLIVGESSPFYLLHPHVPIRVSKLIPNIKLIVLLRNPIERAYSHYQITLRNGGENLSFEDAIHQEIMRIEPEKKQLFEDKYNTSINQNSNYAKYSYLTRGQYYEQLSRWLQYFSKEQFLIIENNNFLTNTAYYMKKIFDFLEIPNITQKEYPKHHVGDYSKSIKQDTNYYLKEYFELHNQKLYELVGTNYNW